MLGFKIECLNCKNSQNFIEEDDKEKTIELYIIDAILKNNLIEIRCKKCNYVLYSDDF
jgi:hypothetical protein